MHIQRNKSLQFALPQLTVVQLVTFKASNIARVTLGIKQSNYYNNYMSKSIFFVILDN